MVIKMKKIFTLFLTIAALLTATAAEAMPLINSGGKVVVLTYHLLSERSADWGAYCIPPKKFEEDIKYLKQEGYNFLTASRLAAENTKGKKIAVITFDDGYESDLKYAAPILEKYGACATFFVVGSLVDTKGYLSRQQLAELSGKKCAEIGNHSYTLHNKNYSTLSIMFKDKKYEKEITDDFCANADFIKKITGNSPKAVSYPNGIYSENADKQIKSKCAAISFSTQEIPFRKNGLPIGRKNRGYERNIKYIS